MVVVKNKNCNQLRKLLKTLSSQSKVPSHGSVLCGRVQEEPMMLTLL